MTDDGEPRTAWEVTADEIGASLRYAIAQPTKASRAGGNPESDETAAVL